MLTPSNILVLDEATAAVDVQTDAMLQSTLRGPLFKNRTIITVAHRINTILDSDRVVVLDKGEVAEFGPPQELIAKRGLFYGLVKQAGLVYGLGSSLLKGIGAQGTSQNGEGMVHTKVRRRRLKAEYCSPFVGHVNSWRCDGVHVLLFTFPCAGGKKKGGWEGKG
jgi:ABC-type multidrug transport system ATPase subunit